MANENDDSLEENEEEKELFRIKKSDEEEAEMIEKLKRGNFGREKEEEGPKMPWWQKFLNKLKFWS